MADPDLQIRGRGEEGAGGHPDPMGGGGQVKKKNSDWSKNKVGGGGGWRRTGLFLRTNELECRDDVTDTVKQV